MEENDILKEEKILSRTCLGVPTTNPSDMTMVNIKTS